MATEKKLISLDEALETTHKEVFWTESEQAAVRSFLVKQPKVDAVEVKHGQWVDMQNDDSTEGMWRCSVCGSDRYFDMFDPIECGCYYCPNCGAKMDGGAGNGL